MRLPFFGKSKKGADTELMLVLGEDRKLTKRPLNSTGAYFVDGDNCLAYHGNMGRYTVARSGYSRWDYVAAIMTLGITLLTTRGRRATVKPHGQIGLLFELSSRPYNFKAMKWDERTNSDDSILEDALIEGGNIAGRDMRFDDRMEKLLPVLIISLCIFGVMMIAILFASGAFNKAAEAF